MVNNCEQWRKILYDNQEIIIEYDLDTSNHNDQIDCSINVNNEALNMS